jgi:methylenetetrahydrofolate dehydrogenase (NADP+)/methenyltetrahydrofolate cyclohydrolase
MVIDGKAIAQHILDKLKVRVEELKQEGITPHLAVILIGDDESSKAYVRQKELKIQEIGAAITTHRFKSNFSEDELLALIEELNDDPIVHGIIIQRPLPSQIDGKKVTDATDTNKDVDGFGKDTPYDAPIALAVWRILREVYSSNEVRSSHTNSDTNLEEWLESKKIVILGKGQTAGMPIIKFFAKKDQPLTIVDSQTENREELIKAADIVICAVGKEDVVTSIMLKDDAILVGVGMRRGDDGKLQGDYDETEIANKAAFYTPVPGGVGPVNVAMLLSNLVKASENN